jgi:hypothetical protein
MPGGCCCGCILAQERRWRDRISVENPRKLRFPPERMPGTPDQKSGSAETGWHPHPERVPLTSWHRGLNHFVASRKVQEPRSPRRGAGHWSSPGPTEADTSGHSGSGSPRFEGGSAKRVVPKTVVTRSYGGVATGGGHPAFELKWSLSQLPLVWVHHASDDACIGAEAAPSSSPAGGLPHTARMAKRVRARLRPHGEAVRLLAHGDRAYSAGRRVERVDHVIEAAAQPERAAVRTLHAVAR